MIEIWIQSRQPTWKDWMRLGSTSLREGILLSLDVCPYWYEEAIATTIENYYGTSQYHRAVSEDEFREIKDVYEYIDGQLQDRLRVAKSWAEQQDWVLGSQNLMPVDIRFDTTVDHRKFLIFAFEKMGYVNEYDQIPAEFKKIKDVIPKKLASKDWKILAQLYAKELLQENPKLNLEQLTRSVSNRFDEEKILTAHAGGKKIALPTIEETISKSGWFTRARLSAAK
jgi:hypothetical protein